MAPLAIGLGCRKGCAASVLLHIIREACAGRDLAQARLFTHERKRGEPGLHAAADTLGLPLSFLSAETLRAASARVSHRSERVAALVDVPSVAEAAALAGAGPAGRLIVGRLVRGHATCAVAEHGGPPG